MPAISKLEDLVQGIEDVFLQLLALPAVNEPPIFWIKDVWQRASKLHLVGVRSWPTLGWKGDLLYRFGLRPPRHAVRAHPVPLH